MARIRTIKPEFFTSADICSLPPLGRLLYIALWCESDREGRFVWNPRTFKLRYLPDDSCDILKLCDTLIEAGLIVRYESEGQFFGFIPQFLTHQQINNRESESRIPEPNLNLTREARVANASPDATGTPLVRKGRERKGTLSCITEDWSVPRDWIEEAAGKKPGVSWELEAERFKAHHLSKASRFASWKQAWWTWVSSPYAKSTKPNGISQDDNDPLRFAE